MPACFLHIPVVIYLASWHCLVSLELISFHSWFYFLLIAARSFVQPPLAPNNTRVRGQSLLGAVHLKEFTAAMRSHPVVGRGERETESQRADVTHIHAGSGSVERAHWSTQLLPVLT